MSIKTQSNTWAAGFVEFIFRICSKDGLVDKGAVARLRRGDNPDTEYQCWELLAAGGVDLEKDYSRLPAVTVAAAIARSDATKNGSLGLGQALARCYSNQDDSANKDTPAKARLHRLISCDDLEEVCRILRSVLSLIESKLDKSDLDFVRLLRQLHRFNFDSAQVKREWAQDFYYVPRKDSESKAEQEAAG